MNIFEEKLSEQFGKEGFCRIRSAGIGIAGAGGIGSNCAFNLVRCGFKKFKIADFDLVEYSNLNRQFYFFDQAGEKKVEALKKNLLRINPAIAVETFHGRIERDNAAEVFAGFDIVVEAFDKAEDKKSFVESMAGVGRLMVSVSGLGGVGMSDGIRVHRIRGDLVVIGDLESDTSLKAPVSPRVNVAAAKQADVILEYVLNGRIRENI